MLLLSELDVVTRNELRSVVARPVVSSRRMSSWDLTGLDGDGEALFNEHFHLDCPFKRGGAVWIKGFAIRHDIVFIGAWRKTSPMGAWMIRITTGSGMPAAPTVRRHSRFWRT